MTNYVDNTYYNTQYLCGKTAVIGATVFPYYAKMASRYVEQLTFGNIDISDIPNAVKECTCEVAEYLYNAESTKRADGIKSEKVGEYSVTYDTDGAKAEDAKNANILAICKRWLGDTGLMYCGVM